MPQDILQTLPDKDKPISNSKIAQNQNKEHNYQGGRDIARTVTREHGGL